MGDAAAMVGGAAQSGTLIYQAAGITGYDGATKLLTVTELTDAPANGDTFVIV